jgi:hypothetical protein
MFNLISIAGADGWWVEGDGEPVRVAAWGLTDDRRVVPLTAGRDGKLQFLDREGVRLVHADPVLEEVVDAVDRVAAGLRESTGSTVEALGQLDAVVRSLGRLKDVTASLERLEALVAELRPVAEEAEPETP